jgi:hypothetical protein
MFDIEVVPQKMMVEGGTIWGRIDYQGMIHNEVDFVGSRLKAEMMAYLRLFRIVQA